MGGLQVNRSEACDHQWIIHCHIKVRNQAVCTSKILPPCIPSCLINSGANDWLLVSDPECGVS